VRRGRPPKISRDRIVDGAVRLGLDSFTMQGLAEEIGVSPATLYSHVSGRDEVVGLVGTRLHTAISGFTTDATDWRTWLMEFGELVRRELGTSASALLSSARDDARLRIAVGEAGLRLLMDAGFSAVEAAYAVWMVVRVAVTASSGAEPSFTRFLDPTADLVDASSDRSALPALRQVHQDLTTSDDHDTFEFDLDVLLDGIAARLERTTGA
jgi:AcrR family transcriptional regulator